MTATHPIVLAHGICRFDVLLRGLLDDDDVADRTHYFRRIRSTLVAREFAVFHANVPWAAGVRRRAAALRDDIRTVLSITGADKVHLIAHSMGGLDARRMLYDFRGERLHDRIASLTTIGTPHLGTTFADWGVTNAEGLLFVLRMLGIDDINGFLDLTTHACAAFNQEADAFERTCGVVFQTIAGAQELPYVFEPLRMPWLYIHLHEGPNDGLVSVRSAHWRPEYARGTVLLADHLNQLGWWDPNDLGLLVLPPLTPRGETRLELETRIRRLYVDLATDLATRFPV